jgi:Fe-S cluster biosynthesis and repair protein YggX
MVVSNERIEQFRKMAEADPTNEIGHFSLGRELLAAGDLDGAVASLKRVIELNPNISRAYQLAGNALQQQGKTGEAIELWTKGVIAADARGEFMPRNEMLKLLTDAGAAVPELASKGSAQEVGEGEVLCKRCGRIGKKLPRQPFKSEFGKAIYDQICTDCWREAIGLGTKVINELRLPMADPQAQKVWDQHVKEFLNLE